MPSAPTRSFADTDRRLADTLKALAHPARLAIVRLLAERDERTALAPWMPEEPVGPDRLQALVRGTTQAAPVQA